MEIMARKIEDLPDNISKQFLKLKKESILLDMQEQLKQRQKLAAQKEKESQQPTSTANQPEQSTSTANQPESFSSAPESQPGTSESLHDLCDEEIDPMLDSLT
ncbi:hypothetical protein PGT21_034000 [Puccinia graminis f. sp. tritici]|uniref:Uncharacterized protein n=1 Tax=Puccinia graminis f. sp. tritici TaxID=56615 RepID=A0A5B0M0H3_PUCGR|nr:hypothetical protein PGT21_034000 [Puccinia graminis f. sp. tritici]